jgi:hypothetical protein
MLIKLNSSSSYIHRKLGTAVITSFTAFHTIFQVDYGDQDHVFTGIQKWYRQKVDDILIGKIDERQTETFPNNIKNELPNNSDVSNEER